MKPLAEILRPQQLKAVIGQRHLLGVGKPLSTAVFRRHSMILWGPPGSGKTTLARLFAQSDDCAFITLSAVTDGLSSVRDAIKAAQTNQQGVLKQDTVLFVDEVHRFNKAQQDSFLPHIESGLITFIGATTENPSFEINRALLSRCQVHQLEPLNEEDLQQLLQRAQQHLTQHFETVDLSAVSDLLIQRCHGDGRQLLNQIEQLQALSQDGVLRPSMEQAQQCLGARYHVFDKQGDHWYDMISAVHKSIRGSDPDAGLYWFVRMVEAGCDPLYIARRLLAIASEDIGNADPRALQIALAAWQTFERLGAAEGERAIAHAIIYLACAPKSNAIDKALKAARNLVQEQQDYSVPTHLRNAPTALAKSLGHGAQYRYSHDEPYAVSFGQHYFPEALLGTEFYHPTDRGLEMNIKKRLDWLRSQGKASDN